MGNPAGFLISTRLQPGVGLVRAATNRFNGLLAGGKPLKRFSCHAPAFTGLKPGANESGYLFGETQQPVFAGDGGASSLPNDGEIVVDGPRTPDNMRRLLGLKLN